MNQEESKPEDAVFVEPVPTASLSAKKVSKLARRSSILNIARRQSKSMCGSIAFEDQVAAIEADAPVEVRLRRLARICASATIRAVKEVAADESKASLADGLEDVAASVQKANYPDKMNCDMAKQVAKEIESLPCSSQTVELLSASLSSIRDYTGKMERESQTWKMLENDRKEKYLAARSDKRSVVKSGRKISKREAEELGALDHSKYTDECQAMKKLMEQERDFQLLEAQKIIELKRKRKRLSEVSDAVDKTMTNIISSTDKANCATGNPLRRNSDFRMEVDKFVNNVHS